MKVLAPAGQLCIRTPLIKLCSIVLKYIKNIFRLDFDILVLDQPDATTTIGACTGKDTLLVDLSNGSDPPTLCGTISGHHSKIDSTKHVQKDLDLKVAKLRLKTPFKNKVKNH